jgi:hypothetical protein
MDQKYLFSFLNPNSENAEVSSVFPAVFLFITIELGLKWHIFAVG